MAGISDATQEQVNNGGRTMGEILEDMKKQRQAQKANSPIRKFLNAAKSSGINYLKEQAKAYAEAYTEKLSQAADEAGLSGDEKDAAIAEEYAQFSDEMTDSAAETMVNGPSPQGQQKLDEAEGKGQEKTDESVYTPSEEDRIRMSQAAEKAGKEGLAAKSLGYTQGQLEKMGSGDLVKAAMAGLAPVDELVARGIDTAEVLVKKQFNFGSQALKGQPEMPKGKKLPDYMPANEFGIETTGVVMSANDMEVTGAEEDFGAKPSSKKETMEEVATASVGAGEQEVAKADLGLVRGSEADLFFDTEAILANGQQSMLDGLSRG